MRSLAWMYVWWPGMDSEIEKTECQAVQAAPPLAPLKVTPGPFQVKDIFGNYYVSWFNILCGCYLRTQDFVLSL